jgi:inhibitor of KinA sporulation pathway (predicted exonuclease)
MNNLDIYNYYLVVDLEATCCDQKSIKRHETEIIEIGAVMVDGKSLESVSELQIFIKPIRYPKLTEFCKNLTHITQANVDTAIGFSEAMNTFEQWFSQYENFIFCSWGDYDKNQFEQDCKFHKIPYPLGNQHLNLKKLFTIKQKLPKKLGMAQALELANLPLEGTHHRGIDDARNIAKLLPYIVGNFIVEAG